MSKYIYSLKNYHAIRQADIVMDGITVLAGENGCGKSTLSRWLYYTINGSMDFEKLLFQEYVASIQNFVSKWEFVYRDIQRSGSPEVIKPGQSGYKKITTDQFEQLLLLDKFSAEDIERAQMIFAQTLDMFADVLYNYLNEENRGNRKIRILNFLEIKLDDFPTVKEAINAFVKKYERLVEIRTNNLYSCLHERRINDFARVVNHKFDETDSFPAELQIREDGLDLLDNGSLASIYNLHKAFYVDTPMAITGSGYDNYFWNELKSIMLSASSKNIPVEARQLIKRIKYLIGGEAKLVQDDTFDDLNELRYVSDDEEVDIELGKTATGFKTFIYLQRLLQNGCLTDSTLLLIDEPEAHLHPQWIVEYARLLVLINKNLGTKIMIASHNPDMVAAIRSIAEREKVLDSTHFYLAERMEGCHQYVYEDLGCEIGEIFRSFNIALDRIKQYGSDSI